MPLRNARQQGFTLIELSIVLVIIGLIVGGILTGRALIRTAELNSVITDETRYVTAVNTFRTKYNELPGDMVDATTYWGTDPGGCPDFCSGSGCYTAAQTTTCNGNGNGLIEPYGTTSGSNLFENFRAWQQLANAGLMPGAYTGTQGALSEADNEPGLNDPASKLANAGFEWMVFYPDASNVSGSSFYNAQLNTQYLLFGSSSVSAVAGYGIGEYDLTQAVLTPIDAYAIDAKIDDGLPYSGTVLAPGYQGAGNNSICAQNYGSINLYNTNNWGGTNSNILSCSLAFQVKSW